MQMQKSGKSYPKKKEIFIADLDPGYGREIRKKRPVLIASSDSFNQAFPTVVIIPFSSIIPGFVGPDVIKFSRQKGLEKESALITTQIRSIDKDRLIKKIGKISKQKFLEVEEAVKLVLGLEKS